MEKSGEEPSLTELITHEAFKTDVSLREGTTFIVGFRDFGMSW